MTMFEMFGIFREEGKMNEGLTILDHLKTRFNAVSVGSKQSSFNQALVAVLELEGMLQLAEVVGRSAVSRRESRGSHARTDYPDRDDKRFQVHTMAWNRNSRVEIAYRPVGLGRFPVEERKY